MKQTDFGTRNFQEISPFSQILQAENSRILSGKQKKKLNLTNFTTKKYIEFIGKS